MLGGRLRDSLVGRDLLVGALCGALFGLIQWTELAGRSQSESTRLRSAGVRPVAQLAVHRVGGDLVLVLRPS